MVRRIPLIILDPSSSDSSDSDDTGGNVPPTPPPAPASPVPAPPASPPPPTPPPPQSPSVSHSDSSGHIRTPVRFPTVPDDSDDRDHPVLPLPRGRPRTRAAARKNTGYRPTGPLAPRDMFPHSNFEVGGSSHQPQPDYGRQLRVLSADVEEIRSTARGAAWEARGVQMMQIDMEDQIKELEKTGSEWKQQVEGQIQGIIGTVTQYHLEMLVQSDRFQQMLMAVGMIGVLAVFVSLLPLFWR